MLAMNAAPADEWAEQLAGMMDPYDSAPITVDWKDLNVSRDTKLPVYSAPFDDAWRGAKGKASVSVKERFTLLTTKWMTRAAELAGSGCRKAPYGLPNTETCTSTGCS